MPYGDEVGYGYRLWQIMQFKQALEDYEASLDDYEDFLDMLDDFLHGDMPLS
jgi:hypothetical protein